MQTKELITAAKRLKEGVRHQIDGLDGMVMSFAFGERLYCSLAVIEVTPTVRVLCAAQNEGGKARWLMEHRDLTKIRETCTGTLHDFIQPILCLETDGQNLRFARGLERLMVEEQLFSGGKTCSLDLMTLPTTFHQRTAGNREIVGYLHLINELTEGLKVDVTGFDLFPPYYLQLAERSALPKQALPPALINMISERWFKTSD